MISAICTLFEGEYHYGVGALANSVYAQGFRGTIFVGYRGSLPPWVSQFSGCDETGNGTSANLAKDEAEGVSHGGKYAEFSVAEGLKMRFIELVTKIHFAHFKPDFMLEIFEKHCPLAETVYYIDPDIIVRFPWSFYEEWASDAIALCEDINSPMASDHPKRNAWRRLLSPRGIDFKNRLEIYMNSGFVGLPRRQREFLMLWSRIITQISEAGAKLDSINTASDYRFWFPDQEAMNIALMATDCPTSCAGKEGMGFELGNSFMVHAIGSGKPWKINFIFQFLAGNRLTHAQREFWEYVRTPIKLYPAFEIFRKRLEIKLAAFGSRFYRR